VPPVTSSNSSAQATVPTGTGDDDLLRRLAGGERAALATMYDEHSGAAFALAQRVCRRHADDIVEEAFLELWRETRAGRGEGAVRSRVMRITMNRSLAVLNDGDRRTRRAGPRQTIPRRPSAIALVDDDARSAIDALTGCERECVELAYFDGLSVAEISSRMRLPPAAVSDRLTRGMDRLHGILAAETTPSNDPPFPQ
jgi:RNA polymerase sigma-70 factor (ECF subfamily)